jgi:hypothetical protein
MTLFKRTERAINAVLKRATGGAWWVHFINENHLPGSTSSRERLGTAAKHGRVYLNAGDAEISTEWAVRWRGSLGGGLYIDDGGGDDQLSWHISLLWFFWAGGFQGLLPRKFPEWIGTYRPLGKTGEKFVARRIEIKIHDGQCWVRPWGPDNSWSSDDPWWWAFNFSLDPRDALGRVRVTREVIREQPVEVPTPERVHRGTATVEAFEARRRWWPFARRWVGVNIDVSDDPIPVPGKGTCSYNCGPDAIYEFSCHADSVETAVGSLVESALRDRRRYGGSHRYSPPEEPPPAGDGQPATAQSPAQAR